MEKEVIKEVSKMEGCVIATGGGVVLDGENIRLLKKKGILVCLFASADKIKERTKEGGRPLLEEDMEKKIKELLSAREHLYAQFEHKIDTSSLPPQQVAERIVALFDRCRKSG
jgi:shikimate kinase